MSVLFRKCSGKISVETETITSILWKLNLLHSLPSHSPSYDAENVIRGTLYTCRSVQRKRTNYTSVKRTNDESSFHTTYVTGYGRDTKEKRDLRLKPNYVYCSMRTCTLTVYSSCTLFTRRNADATVRNAIRVRAKLSTFTQNHLVRRGAREILNDVRTPECRTNV